MGEVKQAVWYRYNYIFHYSEYGFPLEPRMELRVKEFPVISETPCGVWLSLSMYFGDKKFVLKHAKKRWAYPTKEEALESLIRRKYRHISILKHQLEEAELTLEAALKLKSTGETQ